MRKFLVAVLALTASCAPAFAQTNSQSGGAQPQPDTAVIKQPDGSALMWEVTDADKKSAKKPDPDEQRKIDQALFNQQQYMQQAAQQNTLPPTSDTVPGAITPPFIPYSTVPGGPYNVSGSTWTPFNIRNYSYGGNSQSFGAPMFYGGELPSPALGYPAGYPLGTMPLVRPLPIPVGPATTGATPGTTAPIAPSPGTITAPRRSTLLPADDD